MTFIDKCASVRQQCKSAPNAITVEQSKETHMQSSSRRHLVVSLAAAGTLIVTSACSSASPHRSWVESEGAMYTRCDKDATIAATTMSTVDTSITPGDVRMSIVDAHTDKPIPGVHVSHAYAQITPDSLAFSNNDGTLRLHYLQRSAVVVAVHNLGWSPDSVVVDTRNGNNVRFALHALCAH
jgi:hypothetical protein